MEEINAKTEKMPSLARVRAEKELEISSQRLKEGLARSLVRTGRMLKDKEGREKIIQDPVGSLSKVTGIKDREFLEQLFEGTKDWIEDSLGVTPEGELIELPETTAYFGLGLSFAGIKEGTKARWDRLKGWFTSGTREERTRKKMYLVFVFAVVLGTGYGLRSYRPELARRPGGYIGISAPAEAKQEQELNEWIAGDLYSDYISGKMFVSPFKIESSRVRALVGFTTYGKGVWFSDRLGEKNKGLLEGVMGRKFTDEELRKWRENPELFLSHLEQMHEEGKVSKEVLDFYKKPRSQIREEYLADYPPLPKGE